MVWGSLFRPHQLLSFLMSQVKKHLVVVRVPPESSSDSSLVDLWWKDDMRLAELGYRSEFRWEFSVSRHDANVNYAGSCRMENEEQLFETIGFAFSIMGIVVSVLVTLSFPLVSGMTLVTSVCYALSTECT